MKILIATHEPATQQLLQSALGPLGHELVPVTGTYAWRNLSSGDYAMVLIDQELDGLDGLDICDQIRRDAGSKPLYVFILASTASRDGLIDALAAGANEYLAQPIDPGELRARVKSAAEGLVLHLEMWERAERLEHALATIKRLEGLLSVCAHCKSIRNALQQWQKFEDFISDHTDAICSHGICPTCADAFKSGLV
jgi:DNA-binding response OmpR family regulator